jgi:predicted RNase H-like HicB family nuclease
MSVRRRVKKPVENNSRSHLSFTIALREDKEEGGFVAECLDMPGCVSQGETEEEAVQNIQSAIKACLEVMFEDCVREVVQQKRQSTSYVGISSQRQVTVKTRELELQAV